MSESNLYYIYIDTKIIGALDQLITYFQAHVFNTNDCIEVICKYYKEIDIPFEKKFKENKIPFKFIKKQSDIQLEKGKTVLYLFNAQSNCRMVANRDLVHIFVTHGESHKLASVKPIIRIYDYVVAAGRVSIDRYLKYGTFTESDIENGRVIPLGDTFIGTNKFEFNSQSDCLVYAPTWEGGIPEENYSSISKNTALKIVDFCRKEKVSTIYIQIHPNLGHRLKEYKLIFGEMLKTFKSNGIKFKLINSKPKHVFFKFLSSFIHKKQTAIHEVKFALTDISAMEMQFISKKIPCAVFIDEEKIHSITIPKKLNEYYRGAFTHSNSAIIFNLENNLERESLYNYFFSYSEETLSSLIYADRIRWLCNYTRSHYLKNKHSLLNLY